MRKSNLALRLGAVAVAGLLGGLAGSAERLGELSAASAHARPELPRPAGQRSPGALATLSSPERFSVASELACFSDGVSCAHALDCCSGGCVNGQCGPRNKSKRRLARR